MGVTPATRAAASAHDLRAGAAYGIYLKEDVMAQPHSQSTHARPRSRTHWIVWTLIAVLLAAVIVATLWVPIYNRTTPALGGFPFFYWYQLLWVPIVALVSWCAYALSRRAQRGPAPGSAGSVPAPPAPETPLSAPTAAAPPLPKRQVPPRKEES